MFRRKEANQDIGRQIRFLEGLVQRDLNAIEATKKKIESGGTCSKHIIAEGTAITVSIGMIEINRRRIAVLKMIKKRPILQLLPERLFDILVKVDHNFRTETMASLDESILKRESLTKKRGF